MKKWLVFLLGFIAGIVFTIIILVVIVKFNGSNNGMTFFEQPRECLSTNDFEVLQVIGDGYALAYEVEWNSILEKYRTTGLLVLVINDDGEYYYDEQIITIPKGKCMRQIGVYKYPTQNNIEKTVPIVQIMDK